MVETIVLSIPVEVHQKYPEKSSEEMRTISSSFIFQNQLNRSNGTQMPLKRALFSEKLFSEKE